MRVGAPNSLPTDRLFTGQRLERGIGLYYYGARWYDPYIGRFISPEPIVPNPGNPQDLNRYTYARNNPLRYRAPSGHWVETAWDVANSRSSQSPASSDPTSVR
ncbi:MAG TPA: RHS repeat-associated core domain-containing protein [Anaerolineae bacterium]|nr:RHS repeat-associated core domain-containing protein [Anaerolineae bacterium]HIQ05075.1 RHS repeat-associated core domain-containing protein [Anaerolineae bacterium]